MLSVRWLQVVTTFVVLVFTLGEARAGQAGAKGSVQSYISACNKVLKPEKAIDIHRIFTGTYSGAPSIAREETYWARQNLSDFFAGLISGAIARSATVYDYATDSSSERDGADRRHVLSSFFFEHLSGEHEIREMSSGARDHIAAYSWKSIRWDWWKNILWDVEASNSKYEAAEGDDQAPPFYYKVGGRIVIHSMLNRSTGANRRTNIIYSSRVVSGRLIDVQPGVAGYVKVQVGGEVVGIHKDLILRITHW